MIKYTYIEMDWVKIIKPKWCIPKKKENNNIYSKKLNNEIIMKLLSF
jgi:hypothetical protein